MKRSNIEDFSIEEKSVLKKIRKDYCHLSCHKRKSPAEDTSKSEEEFRQLKRFAREISTAVLNQQQTNTGEPHGEQSGEFPTSSHVQSLNEQNIEAHRKSFEHGLAVGVTLVMSNMGLNFSSICAQATLDANKLCEKRNQHYRQAFDIETIRFKDIAPPYHSDFQWC